MKILSRISRLAVAVLFAAVAVSVTSCEDSKSYAELLTDEAHDINRYLADHRVVNSIPKDTVFEVGPDAPFYRLDEDGNIYMQVLDAGTKTPENKVKYNDLVYFRFTRYNLKQYSDGKLPYGEGNASNVALGNYYFRFENATLQSTQTFGSGVQMPLYFLPIDCEVNIVLKSQYGPSNEIANVVPFLYHIRYFKSQI